MNIQQNLFSTEEQRSVSNENKDPVNPSLFALNKFSNLETDNLPMKRKAEPIGNTHKKMLIAKINSSQINIIKQDVLSLPKANNLRVNALSIRLWGLRNSCGDVSLKSLEGIAIKTHKCLVEDVFEKLFQEIIIEDFKTELCGDALISILAYCYGTPHSIMKLEAVFQTIQFTRKSGAKSIEAFYWNELITNNITSLTVLGIFSKAITLAKNASTKGDAIFYQDQMRCCQNYISSLTDYNFTYIIRNQQSLFDCEFIQFVQNKRKEQKPDISDLTKGLEKPLDFFQKTLSKLSQIQWEGERNGDLILHSKDNEEFVIHSLFLKTCGFDLSKNVQRQYNRFNETNTQYVTGIGKVATRVVIKYLYGQTANINFELISKKDISELKDFARHTQWTEFQEWLSLYT